MLTLRAKLAATALGLALMAGPAAHATTVLSDNFNTENGGATALNYTAFTNWASTGGGFVDLVHTPDYGITCAGGGGSCVDLDGSPGPGRIDSIQSFAFHTGDKVTLSFDISGNQRDGSQTDDFYAGFTMATNALLQDYTLGGAWGPVDIGNLFGASVATSSAVGGGAPWAHYSLSWTAGNNGSVGVFFGTNSADNVGPLLDNVNLSIGGVPEPATWALMLSGFGLAGAALRRRKAALA